MSAPPGGPLTILVYVFRTLCLVMVAVVVPLRMSRATENLREAERSIAAIRAVGDAASRFRAQRGTYPRTLEELRTPVSASDTRLPDRDGWGHPLRYAAWQESGEIHNEFAVSSAGADGDEALLVRALFATPEDRGSDAAALRERIHDDHLAYWRGPGHPCRDVMRRDLVATSAGFLMFYQRESSHRGFDCAENYGPGKAIWWLLALVVAITIALELLHERMKIRRGLR